MLQKAQQPVVTCGMTPDYLTGTSVKNLSTRRCQSAKYSGTGTCTNIPTAPISRPTARHLVQQQRHYLSGPPRTGLSRAMDCQAAFAPTTLC
jgi:hypothetical protein